MYLNINNLIEVLLLSSVHAPIINVIICCKNEHTESRFLKYHSSGFN